MRAASGRLAAGGRQVALTVGAVAGVLCLLVMVAGFALGVRPLVFLSGSMSPTIDTGALAIARSEPAADLRVGDIVSVPTPAGQRVTHRIVDVQHLEQVATLRLKGDANEAIDAAPYQVENADVVVFSIPGLGYLLNWLASPIGLFALGLYAALLLSVLVRGATAEGGRRVKGGARRREIDKTPPVKVPASGRHRRLAGPRHRCGAPVVLVLARGLVPFRSTGGRHLEVAPPRPPRPARLPSRRVHPALTLPLTAATVVAGGWVAGSAEPTLAAWADAGTVSGTTVAAYTVPAPDGSTCAVASGGTTSLRGVNLTWPANVAPLPLLSYNTSTTGISGATTNLTDVTVNGVPSKRIQVTYNPGLTANQGKIVTVRATPRLTSTSTWVGPVTTTWKFRTGATNAIQPVCGDGTPAVVAIRAPDGVTRTVAAERTFITGATGCTADIGLCGTIEDASTISSVTYNLKKVRSGVTTYFNGAGWGSPNVQVTAQSTVYNNQLTFYEDSNTLTVYPTATGAGVYTLTVTVTDSWANVTTTSVSFTLT